ncbi:MAG: glutathione S-transferase [Betaproteobacteria bacterium]|nr:glutathione S-transferase [Betaproteobacteria bacterium]
MKMYWSSRSPFVRKAMIAAYESGVAEQIERLPAVVSLSTPNRDVMQDNPSGMIPTLILEDGGTLFDSLVICEYFDSLAAQPKLFPKQGPERWTALKRHALGDNILDSSLLRRSETLKPQARQTPEWLTTFALKLRNFVDAVEAEADALSATPFNIGHIAIGVAFAYTDFRFGHVNWREGHPKAAAWMQTFLQRESVVKTAFVDA